MQASEALLISSDEEIENRPPALPGSDTTTVNQVKRPRKKTATKPSSTKKQKIDGQAIEQHRRKYGDLVKSRINCEKYTISATTFLKSTTALEVFRELVVPHAQATPENFDSDTEVVVALLRNSQAFGEVVGISKIKGGCSSGAATEPT